MIVARRRAGKWTIMSVAAIALASCSTVPAAYIKKLDNGKLITLKLYSPKVDGKCFSPQAIYKSGLFRVDGLNGRDEMAIVEVERSKLNFNLAKIKAVDKITKEGVPLQVKKVAIIEDRFDAQVLVFDCNKPLSDARYAIWTSSINLQGLGR